MAVMTRGGKQTIDPPMPVDEDEVRAEMMESKDAETGDAKAKNEYYLIACIKFEPCICL